MNAPVAMPVRETRRQRKARIVAMADADWNAIPSEVNPRIHAARHLASLSPERQAQLRAEWLTVTPSEAPRHDR